MFKKAKKITIFLLIIIAYLMINKNVNAQSGKFDVSVSCSIDLKNGKTETKCFYIKLSETDCSNWVCRQLSEGELSLKIKQKFGEVHYNIDGYKLKELKWNGKPETEIKVEFKIPI